MDSGYFFSWQRRHVSVLVAVFLFVWMILTVCVFAQGYVEGCNDEQDMLELPLWALDTNTTRRVKGEPEDPSKPSVWFWSRNSWVNVKNFCGHFQTFVSAPLESRASDKNIRVYFPGDRQDKLDVRLNKLVQMMRIRVVQTVISTLKDVPDFAVIDLGSQFVLFSVLAALIGRQVVVITPEMENILGLSKTFEEAGLTSKVTLICSTPAGFRRTIPIRMFERCNSSFVDANITEISSTHLDDAQPFINSDLVIIVLDSHSRADVLSEAVQLFHGLYVQVLIEVTPAFNTNKYKELTTMLNTLDFKPSIPFEEEANVAQAVYILWVKGE